MNVFEIRNGVYIMKNKKIIILSIVLIIIACIGIGILLYVCNMSKNKPEDVLKQYANYINEQNYEEMYNLITDNSKTRFSKDTFIKRNKARDKEYEKLFVDKQNINGRRIHSTMYSRVYID